MHWTLANADSSLPSKPCRRVPTIPIPGATLDCFLTMTSSQHANLQTPSFDIGDPSYNLIPNAQIWPRSLNYVVGGASNSIYLIVNDIGFPEGLAFNFIDGYTFLYDLVSHPQILVLTSSTHSERFYSIFDTNHQRFGIANTIYTNSSSN